VAEPVRIRYVAPPTVSRFLDSDSFIRCIVGPVGSGKSSACNLEVLTRAAAQAPLKDGIRRTRFAIIRNTYRELQDTTRKTFEQWVPGALGDWNEQDFCFTMRFNDVECEVLFRALDRPGDVKKLLSLELTGAYINECRETSKHIFDVLQTRVGRYPSVADGGCTWFGIWMDTNPWHSGHWLQEFFRDVAKVPAKVLEKLGLKRADQYAQLLRQPGGRDPDAENLGNLAPGYYERLCIGKDEDWIWVYVDGKDAKSALGSIYGTLIDALEKAGGLAEFAHTHDAVFTSWDLGRSDATAIWFWRVVGRDRVELIDYYENHLESLKHYLDVVDERGYEYVTHWLPHDARAKTLATELSIEDQCRERWPGKVQIGPALSVLDGIAAARWLLDGHCRIHARCVDGIAALRAYRRKWDEATQAFSPTPVHDWASNGSDAFRYAAVVARGTELLMRPPATEPVVTPVDQKAIDWLARNPNDPAAAAVAAYLKEKGLGHRVKEPERPTLDQLFQANQPAGRERIG
jgi:hypothetical protein